MFSNIGLWNDKATKRVLPRNQQFFFAATRLHQMLAFSSAIVPGRECMTSRERIGFPVGWPVSDFRLFYPHFICDEAGTSTVEYDCPNNASVYCSINVAGVFYPGFFNGISEGVMTPGMAGRWATFPTLPVQQNTIGFANQIQITPLGGVRPIGFSRMSNQNEAAEWSATPNFAKLTGGSAIANTANGRYYGPVCGVGRGNDGRIVPIIMPCDSLDLDRDENSALSDTRANLGFWERGLDENVIGQSLTYANFAVPGSRLRDQASVLPGKFARRDQILRSLPNLPFDRIIVGGGENDSSMDSAAWRQIIEDYLDFINDRYGMPYAVRTMFPKSTSVGNTLFSDEANQNADGSTAARQAVNTLLANGTIPSQHCFDIAPAVASGAGKWLSPLGTFTLTQDAAAGQAHVFTDLAPPTGALLVFGAGTAQVEMREVLSVTGVGPFDCLLTTNLTTGRLTNDVCFQAPTDDGTHYSTPIARALSLNPIAQEKGALI